MNVQLTITQKTIFILRNLSVICIIASGFPARAQEAIEQNIEAGSLSDGILGDTQDFRDGGIEDLDQFNGYPHPDRAQAISPPKHLYDATSTRMTSKKHK